MTRSAAHISVAAFGLAALVLIAGRANAQSATSNSTIQWNDPPGQAPSTGTVSPVPGSATPSAPPPGATKLPPGTVVPLPDSAATGAPPPGATKLPPGTVVPPPDSANSGSIRWNTPQPSASTMVPATPGGPAVSWRSGFQGGVIWVEVIDPASFYRVERIDLVAPDGRAFASREITRTQARYDYTAGGGNVGVGAWGGSHHSGVGVGV
ncbi:MAG TPA: hypothetical protein VL966_20080, partial [Alphaproteobacteria bacterium]|nr:hypothetical protein [Alphaproteobacteria bacterium]